MIFKYCHVRVKYDTHVHIYNEILYILVDNYCSKYGVMGIYIFLIHCNIELQLLMIIIMISS